MVNAPQLSNRHDRLPSYMVPESFEFLESFPNSLSGKLDRSLLPKPTPGLVAARRT